MAGLFSAGGGGSPLAPFALGGGNLGFQARAAGRFILPEISDYWIAGGNEPSFVFEPLSSLEPPLGEASAVAATN
jgi:hypothetical protein